MDQILVVISSLVRPPPLNAVTPADDEELEALRALMRPLHREDLDPEAHMQARMLLMSRPS